MEQYNSVGLRYQFVSLRLYIAKSQERLINQLKTQWTSQSDQHAVVISVFIYVALMYLLTSSYQTTQGTSPWFLMQQLKHLHHSSQVQAHCGEDLRILQVSNWKKENANTSKSEVRKKVSITILFTGSEKY